MLGSRIRTGLNIIYAGRTLAGIDINNINILILIYIADLFSPAIGERFVNLYKNIYIYLLRGKAQPIIYIYII